MMDEFYWGGVLAHSALLVSGVGVIAGLIWAYKVARAVLAVPPHHAPRELRRVALQAAPRWLGVFLGCEVWAGVMLLVRAML